MTAHPVRLVVHDDYHRNRLAVFFRLFMAIPHLIWFFLWSALAAIVAILNWVLTLILGRPPRWIHRFLCAFVRYSVHLGAWFWLAADQYPGFSGESGGGVRYPVDLDLPEEPQAQSRWKTLLRLILAIPAFIIGGFLGGGVAVPAISLFARGRGSGGRVPQPPGLGLLTLICGVFGWFAALATGRMPKGLRDANAYAIGYSAQVVAYVFLLTDVYPNSDPTAMLETVEPPPAHPVRLVGDAHDLRRSRVTVFFRLPLAIPHFVWLELWGVVTVVVVLINWFATLILGRSPRWCHRFISRFVRYQLHVLAFLSLAANPFPGFTGRLGTYPLDLELPEEPQRQSRLKTFFRLLLAIPAFYLLEFLGLALLTAAFFTWFVALFTGRAPWGLRNLMAYVLRYGAQVYAYLYLLTDRYPHASPLEGADPQVLDAAAA